MKAATTPDSRQPEHHRTNDDTAIVPLPRGGNAVGKTLLEQALEHQAKGFSVIVVDQDKKPRGPWKAAQTRQLSKDELQEGIRRGGNELAVVGGHVSEKLVVFDFDPDKLERAIDPFDLKAEFVDPWTKSIAKVIDPATLPRQRTPSGGWQFFVRFPGGMGNSKLASVPAWQVDKHRQVQVGVKGPPHCATETRGEGGYAVIPTGGSSRYWENLSLAETPTVSPEVGQAMLEAARKLDRIPTVQTEAHPKTARARGTQYTPGTSLIAAFNAAHDLKDLLEKNGYTFDERAQKYLAPNSTSRNAGVSIDKAKGRVISHHQSDLLHAVSASGKLLAHDAFGVWTLLEHDGDQTAALAAWREVKGNYQAQARVARATPNEGAVLGGAGTPEELPELDRLTPKTKTVYLGADEMLMRRAKGAANVRPGKVAFVAAGDLDATVAEIRRICDTPRFVFLGVRGDTATHRAAFEHDGTVAVLEEGNLGKPTPPDPMVAYQSTQGDHYRRLIALGETNGAEIVVHDGPEAALEELEDNCAHMLGMPKSYGKTQLAAHTMRADLTEGKKAWGTAHLRSLIGGQVQACGTTHYETNPTTANDELGLSRCINSYWRAFGRDGKVVPVHTHFADEITALMRRFTSKDDFAKKPLCWDAFAEYVAHTPRQIFADADMNQLVFDLLNLLDYKGKIKLHVSSYLNGAGKTIIRYQSWGSVVQSARRALDAGGNVLLHADTKADAKRLAVYFGKHYPDLPLREVHSGTSGEPEVKAFFADVNTESKRYRILIASPSISTGVSITHDHFTWVGGVFSGEVRTAADAHQALMRTRAAKEFHVWVNPRRRYEHYDADAIRASLLDNADPDMLTGRGGAMRIRDADYEAMYFAVKSHEIDANNRYSALFWQQALEEGYTVIDGEETADAARIKTEASAEKRHHWKEWVKSAPQKTPDEISEILSDLEESQREPTLEEQAVKERYQIEHAYGLTTESPPQALDEALEFDREGVGRRKLSALEQAVAPIEHIAQLEKEELKRARGKIHQIDCTPYRQQRRVRRLVLKAAMCNPDTLFATGDGWYHKGSTSIDRLRKQLETLRPKLAGVTGLPTLPEPDEMEHQIHRYMGKVLESMAIPTVSRKQGRYKRIYRIDEHALAERRELLIKRGKFQGETQEPVNKDENSVVSHQKSSAFPPITVLPLGEDRTIYLKRVLAHLRELPEFPDPQALRAEAVAELVATFSESSQDDQRERWGTTLLDIQKSFKDATQTEILGEALGLLGWARERQEKGSANRGAWTWIMTFAAEAIHSEAYQIVGAA